MPKEFQNQEGQRFVISDKPIATPGGEGAIYDVIVPANTDMVAKIYHTSKIANIRRTKIEFMVDNSPTKEATKEIKEAIVWPTDTLYINQPADAQGVSSKQFVGFTMPKISDAITLKSLTLPGNPSQRHGAEWKKFDHNQKGSHQKRLAIAYNLAQAIHTIHEKGYYVLVDLKPENIFIKPNGVIAIIDMDSIQIDNPGDDRDFPAKVYTEEYAPPEFHQKLVNPKDGDIHESWDYFSLAVILYELLFGIHPFQASHKTLTTRPEMIKYGMFVHGKKLDQLHVIPYIHKSFRRLNLELQKIFVRTFDEGQSDPAKRANAKEWADNILKTVNLDETYNTQITTIPPKKPTSALTKRRRGGQNLSPTQNRIQQAKQREIQRRQQFQQMQRQQQQRQQQQRQNRMPVPVNTNSRLPQAYRNVNQLPDIVKLVGGSAALALLGSAGFPPLLVLLGFIGLFSNISQSRKNRNNPNP